MSRITKWKLEKTKVKVVFRLQFHATHIPQTGWDKLFISFISADSGKATAKTTKANVRNGTCKWGDPIYETTRLLQDTKTKQYDEKLYKLVITMGSSRSSVLGEANINLADYADALKPYAVALPLQGCDSGTVLHVTVQLLTSKTGFREFEQQRELRESGLQTSSDQTRNDVSTVRKISSSEDTVNDQIDKVNARVRFKEELFPLEEEVGLNDEYADSTVGFDGSSNTSESLYAEKHDISSTHEIDSLKSTTSGDLGGPSLSQSPGQEKGDPSDQRLLAQGTNEWAHGWSSDYSADTDLPNAYEENSRLRGSLEAAESSILELKQEVSSLQSHADEIGTEAQKFALQLDAEIASGEQLAKEVSILRSECSKLKEDLEEQKSSKLSIPFTTKETIETGQDYLLHELQVRWFKGLLDMEDKIRELQSKVCFGVNERDFRSFHSDLEALLGGLLALKQVTGQANSGMNMASVKETGEMCLHKGEKLVLGNRFDADFYQPEGALHCPGMPGLVSQDFDSVDATNVMKDKVFELLREVDELKAERESLAKKADQMECYYEALIHELEENQRQMMGEVQNLRNDHSTCLYTISSAKAEVERIQQDMNNEIIKFNKEKRDLDSLNKEFERRATTAEAALKRARLNYSIAVGQLQKDLEVLSFQVLSMYETNENLVKQAFADSLLPSFQGCEETMQNQKLDSEEFHDAKHLQCQNQCYGVKKQHLDGDIFSDDLKKSLLLQKGIYQKVEEEIYEVHLVNVYLDVFSKALQVTLLEASADFGLMEEKVHELTQQLELSTESKELLMLRLQTTLDEICCLQEYKDTCNSKCHDLTLKNQILESNLQNISCENHLLTQKISEWKGLIKEYETYESKYKVCTTEKLELANLLEKETLENGNLQNRLSSLQEELKAVRTDYDELAFGKENLQNIVNVLQGKLWNLLSSYDQKYKGLSLCSEGICQDLESDDLTGVVLQIEELQHNVYEKIVQIMEEKKDLTQERDNAQVSLSTAASDHLIMKQKFEHDLRSIMDKLDVSNALVQKLQLQVEVFANRLEISSEAEENYAQQHRELLSDLDHLEVELQQLTSKNQDLAEEIVALETVTEELARCNLTIGAVSEEKEALVVSLQDKTVESSKLSLELNSLQGSLLSLHDELHIERNLKDKLESTIADLTSQMNEKHCQLLEFDQQKSELVHLKQLVSALELEKSRVSRLLLDSEECLKDVHEECSSISALETQLSEMHEFSLAADVRVTFTKAQYEARIEELDQKLHFSDSHLAELHNNHLNVENMLNSCLASERHYIEENTKLMTSLNCLKSELEACIAQNRILIDTNGVMTTEIEEYKKGAENMESIIHVDRSQCALEIERLEHLLVTSEEEIDNLIFSKEELEVKFVVLKDKLDEQCTQIALLEGSKHELTMLQNECSELTQRLSEQVLKTEEFKNLSIHFKELKDKAYADCAHAHDKREPEGPPAAMQESLRIAFIKEQYETKLQELKQQLAFSKKHSEEMLWKLQDAIDEVENRKKSEAIHVKRNEELGMRILELESELHSLLSEKREIMKAYDLMKAEKECSLISLDCCREEKQELEASLQKCNEEKVKIILELTSMKDLLESSTSSINMQREGNDRLHKADCTSDELVVERVHHKNSISGMQSNGMTEDQLSKFSQLDLVNDEAAENECLISIDEADPSNVLINIQPVQADVVSRGVNGIPGVVLSKQKDVHSGDMKHLVLANEHFKAQSLKSSMDNLNKELERMKHENSLVPLGDHHFDPNFPGLERELMQLNKVNEELGSIFPLFNEFSCSGNALERVLALEVELAEALQAKKKSSLHIQSSFLKQHSDEEAVFHSFRDINELIKDMLELKGRYATVETELKEMHDRYSQLSLQFAEVEGERQKLMMTLKNVRASKKALCLNRSSTTSFLDP